jgi:tetratricopeptide (TPR) repeat protein
MQGVGFLDFALEDNAMLATLDVADTLAGFSHVQHEAFLTENQDLSCEMGLYQSLSTLARHLREDSLFTAAMRNRWLSQIWSEFLADGAPRRIHALRNEIERLNFRLVIDRSAARPSGRFPAWLLYPLKIEVEGPIRKALSSFLVELKLSSSSTVPLSRGSALRSSGTLNKSGSKTRRRGVGGLDARSGSVSSGSEADMSILMTSPRKGTPRRSYSADPSGGSGESTEEVQGVVLSVRATALNTTTSKAKFAETECTLDRINRTIFVGGKLQVELDLLQSALKVTPATRVGLGPSEFSITTAGFRYDFRASDAVVTRWTRIVSTIQSEEEALLKERVEKRNFILAVEPGLQLPLGSHVRTFAPEVRAPEGQESTTSSEDEMAEEEAHDDEEDGIAVQMPWAHPSPHLDLTPRPPSQPSSQPATPKGPPPTLAATKLSSGGSSSSVASISSSYGLTVTQILSARMELQGSPQTGYGSVMSPGVGAAAGAYGQSFSPPASLMAAYGSSPTMPPTISMPPKVTMPPAMSMPPLMLAPGNESPLVTRAYHETVPFQYHSVPKTTAGDASLLSPDDHAEGDDSDEPVSPRTPAQRSKSTPMDVLDSVLRKEEQTLSKKLHRSKPAPPAPLPPPPATEAPDSPPTSMFLLGGAAAMVAGSNLAAKGYYLPGAEDIGGGVTEEEPSPRTVNSDSDSDTDLEPSHGSTSADSQLERARRKYGDFNERFQRMAELMKRDAEGGSDSHDKILCMSDDFLESAKRYGRVILDEAFVAEEKKTIQPVVPGGNVFRVGHIVLELNSGNDPQFGKTNSFEMSAKSMGHQLKSFAALEDTQPDGMSFPLLALIDFRGLRLAAYCKLPISEETLRYGPLHGEFHDRDASLLSVLKTCAKELNVKPSFCGVEKRRHRVVGGYGVQLHAGMDGRRYMLQVADFFPCLKPQERRGKKPEKGSELVELFRPEFVQCYPIALSPNAYKPWAQGMPDEEENRAEIDHATKVLETVLVPTFARELTELVVDRGLGQGGELIRADELVHEYGLNVRLMGLVLTHMTRGNPAHMHLLVEMIARVLKAEFRSLTRRRSQELGMVADEPHKALAASLFDVCFAHTPASDAFWSNVVCGRLQSKFNLSRDSWSDFPENLKQHVFQDGKTRSSLFSLAAQMVGVVFDEHVGQLVASDVCLKLPKIVAYEMVVELVPIVRQLDFVAEARGWIYQARGAEHESRGFFSSAKHFYGASLAAYRTALSRSPTNATLLRNIGEVMFRSARLQEAILQKKRNLSMVVLDPELPMVRQSTSYHVRAIKCDHSDPLNFGAYANLLENLHRWDEAEALYLQALAVNPNHVYLLVRYGQFLSHTRQLYEMADAFFTRAKNVTKAAVDLSEQAGLAPAKSRSGRLLGRDDSASIEL